VAFVSTAAHSASRMGRFHEFSPDCWSLEPRRYQRHYGQSNLSTGSGLCGGVNEIGPLLADGGRIVSVSTVDDDFVALISVELPRLQRLARLLVGDVDSAEDVVAEAVARTIPIWRKGEIDDLAAYLRRVVVSVVSRRWQRRALGFRRDRYALDWLTAPFDTAAGVSDRDETLRAVSRLPPRRRAIVALRFYEDMTEARIAEVLGIQLGTVKSQLSKALEQLRVELGALEET
jgi:RNA polymerase sigma factor (sigma-70 family)